MEWLPASYFYLDSFLIAAFRFLSPPIIGFYLGCAVLSLWCVIAGYFTRWAALAVNFKRLKKENKEMVRMHNLSFTALAAREKKTYTAANRQANEAFGKYFFAQIAISASFLWPVPFAMGWLNTRFADVSFFLPGLETSLGFAFPFLLVYIAVCILVLKAGYRLPFFRGADKLAMQITRSGGEMMSLSDLGSR